MREYQNEKLAQRKIAKVDRLARKIAVLQKQLDEAEQEVKTILDVWKKLGDTQCLSDGYAFFKAAKVGRLEEVIEYASR